MSELILANADIQLITADPETGELMVSKDAIAAIKHNEQMKREVKAFDEEFKKRLKEAMEEYHIDKIESDELTVSYVAEHTQTRVDSERFKAVYTKEYYDCLKESDVKASVRVRLK